MSNSEIIFNVVENNQCPYYVNGDQFKLSGNALLLRLQQEKTFVSTAVISPPYEKKTCRILVADLTRILVDYESVDRIPDKTLECSGCTGRIKIKSIPHPYPIDTENDRDHNRKIDAVAGMLSNFSIFQALDRQNLRDIVALLKLKKYARDEIVLKKGDPAQHLYIILAGAVDVLDDKGVRLSFLQKGDVFGEMSLISGEPIGATIKVVEPARIIFIKGQDFKQILNKFPSIQMYLAKLLAQRLAKSNLAVAEEITSGMMGRLSEMPPAEIFQTLNLNQKTGRVSLILSDGTAVMSFRQGELVAAEYNQLCGKEAFFEVLKKSDGRFKFNQSLSETEKSAPVLGTFMEMLLEGLRRMDEERSGHTQSQEVLV
jgi:CRP-like cAMP-binding protein